MQIRNTGILLVLLLCCMLLVPVVADEGYWKSRSIDAERDDLGSYCSLKIDDNDRAYIAYYSDTCKCLKLAWEPGLRGASGNPYFAWSSLTKWGSTTGKGVSLWVNKTDRTFAFSSVNDSWHAFYGEGAFRPAVRDGFAPYLTRLEDITLGFYPAAGPTSLIRYWVSTGVTSKIAFIGSSNQQSSLVIIEVPKCLNPDPQYECSELPHSTGQYLGYRGDGHSIAYHNHFINGVCFYDSENGTLVYENWYVAGSNREVVDGSLDAPAGRECALAYDMDGNPHISYRDMSGAGGLKYAFKNETGWHTVMIDPRRDTGHYSSIVIDANNEPHISYSAISSLWYASVNGSTWYTQQVDRNPTLWTSIDVDSKNRPRIAYYDSNKKDLRYAWWEPYIHGHHFPG